LPIVTYAAISPGKTPEQLSYFVDDVVKRALQGVRNVAQVERIGGVEREILVSLDPDRLQAAGLTAVLVALTARALTDLDWNECFLIGALLSPTDPVLSSGVVTNPRVPRLVRHSLNLESGLNDGLALPAVLAFSAALRIGDSDFVWWKFVLQDVSLGLVFGIATGLLASRLMPRGRDLRENIAPHQQSLYALGVAFAAYGLAVATPEGNGFIAVYVCAITLGIRRPDIRASFEHRSQDLIEVVKLGLNQYSRSHLRVLKILANQMALSVANARLIDRLAA